MNVFTLGRTLTIIGDVSASEDLVVNGTVNGAIRVPGHAIVIGPAADIKGDVLAATVELHGTSNASIVASKGAVVRASATIVGRVAAPRVVVEDGATVNAHLDTRNVEAAVKVATYRAERA